MGRLIIIVICVFMNVPLMFAQYRINYDSKTRNQVIANTASQEAVEVLHNQTIDTIRKKQEKLMSLTGVLAASKTAFLFTLENAEGFGVRSGVYKSIIATSGDIVKRSASAVSAICDANLTGEALAIFKVSELVTQAAHLGNLFFDIVTNATVANPMAGKMDGAKKAKKDAINLLNRHERLKMALDIRWQLKKIDHQLMMVEYYCKHNSLNDLLLALDRKTWITYHYANFSTKRLVDQWNMLGK